jgi:hypothetical protein
MPMSVLRLEWGYILITAIHCVQFRQFWNCAEIKVVRADKVPTSVTNPNVSEGWDVAANKEACADDTYNYSEAIEGCTGYTYCIMGKPTRTKYCREGMLYDQTEQKCKHADEVNCGGRPVRESDTLDGLESTGSDQSIGVGSLPEEERLSTTILATSEIHAESSVTISELPVIESPETDEYNSEVLPPPTPTYMDYDESMQPTIVSSGSHQDAATKGYYLDPITGSCYLNDGSRPTWIEIVFPQYDECCELSWNKDECLALNPIDEETYNPSNKPTKKPQMSQTFKPSIKSRPTSGESSSES